MAEGARLESVYTLIAYRGFESLSLRQIAFLSMTTIERDTESQGVPGCVSGVNYSQVAKFHVLLPVMTSLALTRLQFNG